MGFILAQGGKLHPSVIVLAAPHFLRVGGGVKFLVEKLGGGGDSPVPNNVLSPNSVSESPSTSDHHR